jgi:Uma2 family endonuclease
VNGIIPPPAIATKERQQMVLYGVDWATYEKLIDAFAELHVRMTYDQGTLELMSPLPRHERLKHWFGNFFRALSAELDVQVYGVGSTTLRSRPAARGLEADEWFYVASTSRVQDWDTLDLAVEPPPDLAIEIDITSTVLNRLDVYAGLRVPELWRFDEDRLQVLCLAGTTYQESTGSASFPYLPVAEVVPLLTRTGDIHHEGRLIRTLTDWFRDRVRPLYDAWRAAQPPTTEPPSSAPQRPTT